MRTIASDGNQISLFDGNKPLKITKPLRLIELFAGIGAQAKALENLGVTFEHYRICEFDKYAVTSYNAVHGTNFYTSDITKIHAEDLGIVETDKYEYIMTYSFPCTDLSKAGKQQGMSRGSGTRSGLLWEVERLLKETKQLPQILLMENVPDVLSEKNCEDFYSWCDFLEKLGYTSKYAILNSKDYGVPQNRERCFMLSWLGEDYYYDFPDKIPLSLRLKDVLEKKVDEKYYLSEKTIKYFIKHTRESIEKGNGFRFEPTDGNVIGKTITTRAGSRTDDNFIKCEHIAQLDGVVDEPVALDEQNGYLRKDGTVGTLTTDGSSPKHNNRVVEPNCCVRKLTPKDGICYPCMNKDGYKIAKDGDGVVTSRPHQARLTVICQKSFAIRAQNAGDSGVCLLENQNYRIRKLTPKECWRLMGFDDESFSRAEQVVSNSQLYKQAGNSIVVDVLMAIFKKLF